MVVPDMLGVIQNYRNFILGSVIREFQAKYRNSLLGIAWTLIQPLSMILVYTLIFTQVMQAKLPGTAGQFSYSIYLCSGILIWGFFSEITSRSLNIFIDNANLIKKINFPKICLPIISTISASISFSIISGIFLLFLFFSKNLPGWTFLAVIPLTAIVALLALGLGITLGVFNVFFRDVGQFFGIFLQFWFWLTPIVYPANILPETLQRIIKINPMVPLIQGFQNIFVHSQWPHWISLLYPLTCAIALCFLGSRIYKKKSGEMIDEL
jgi:lipopolysaccharide transport system permease protein